MTPTDLEARLHNAGTLAGIQLDAEARAYDEDPDSCAVNWCTLPRLCMGHLPVIPFEVSVVKASFATSNGMKDAGDSVEDCLISQRMVAIDMRQHKIRHLAVVPHGINKFQL
mmetsp:Transcript_15987/g.37829  ORF Transcript_15987/g.37829 Transcript_15987/m.37829 type:complete len:112 (-) Transcript_15987:836-1171(-)